MYRVRFSCTEYGFWIGVLACGGRSVDTRPFPTIDTEESHAMMRTPTSYFIKAAAGFHYCKVLSPFNVLEWIYVDSLHEFDGIWNDEDQPQEFLQ